MNINICKNIAKLRRENGMTQAQVAEYLGVSPQAVSKWEGESGAPDIYLIPKIAFLFGVSIDNLFGTSDIDTADLLVSRYAAVKNDKNYKEAKDSIDTLLEMNSEEVNVLGLQCKLQLQRAYEFLYKGKESCERLLHVSKGKDESWHKRAKVQLIRLEGMLGNYNFIESYMEVFEKTRKVDDFNYLLIALGEINQYEEMRRWEDDYIESFTEKEQGMIYPNLMEVALKTGDVEYGQICFDKIINNNEDKNQIFNAWWLLWKIYGKVGNVEEAQRCREELLRQLPELGLNEFSFERLEGQLNGSGEKNITIL